jgi:hypothetical protein
MRLLIKPTFVIPSVVFIISVINTNFDFITAGKINQAVNSSDLDDNLIATSTLGRFGTNDFSIDFWFNIAAQGAYQEYHLHPKSHFSLVYYVQTQKQCGNIVFQTADTLTDMFPLIADQATYASYKNCFYTPKDSLLLIFKSTLLHMVEKNLSDKDRISVAMNFKFKEK